MSLPEFKNSYLVLSPRFLLEVTHQPLPRLAVTVHTSFLSLGLGEPARDGNPVLLAQLGLSVGTHP